MNVASLATMMLQECLAGLFTFWHAAQRVPIDVAAEDNRYSEPEPDLVVLGAPLYELGAAPRPESILLLVEVADLSLALDLTIKADLYARAGIPDYWVLDVNQRRMIVHRDAIAGKYSSVVVYREDESVSPLAAPQSNFHVAAVGQ